MLSNILYAITLDDLSKSVVYLKESKPSYEIFEGKKYEIWRKNIENQELLQKVQSVSGTGFLTSHNGKIYLVTVAHIAKNISNKAEIYWNTESGKMNHFTFEFIQQQIPQSKWFFHPTADVAIHPFGFTEKSKHSLIAKDLFFNKDEPIPIGTDIYILGFPLHLGVTSVLSPLSKKAETASSLTSISNSELSPNLLFILLDQDLAQGYSGAPVFISPELGFVGQSIVSRKPKLIGIQSSTMSDQTGGKISLVVPAFYLTEIFESDLFKKFEEQIGQKHLTIQSTGHDSAPNGTPVAQ